MPTLTKKDFQMVAGILRRVRAKFAADGLIYSHVVEAIDDLAPLICDDLAATNPAFDRDRFINAVQTGKETR